MSGSSPDRLESWMAPLAAAAVLATAPPLAAQPLSAGDLAPEAALSAGSLVGSDFEAAGVGAGGEVGLRYGLAPRLSLGLMGQGTWHATEGLDGPLRLLGIVLEPRYALAGDGGDVTPFVGARVGVARWNAGVAADTLSADVRADGLQAGGSVGVAYSLTESVTVEAAAVASHLTFGDAQVEARLGGESLPPFAREGSSSAGTFLGLRGGVRWTLP